MIYCRMCVKIATPQGVFYRVGSAYPLPGGILTIAGYDGKGDPTSDGHYRDVTGGVSRGILSYPSQDVTYFRIYVTDGSPTSDSTVWKYLDYKAVKSDRANYSYALTPATVPETDFPAGQTQTTLQINNLGRAINYDPNRVLVSTPYKPRAMNGKNALYVGSGAEDVVLAFGANAKAISEGQFGQYPLYVFCKNSVWAMQVGSGDVAFESVSPISISAGVVGKHAIANMGSTIVYGSQEGIKTIPESDMPLSYPIQNTGDDRDILKIMNEKTSLGHYYDVASGRSEVWVSVPDETLTDGTVVPGKTFCYSLQYGRWFTLSETSNGFARIGGKLLRIKNGVVYDNSLVQKSGSFTLAPLTMGEPDVLKRFRAVVIHYTGESVTPKWNTTAYEMPVSGGGSSVKAIDVEYEFRYTHRTRVRSRSIDVKP